MPGNPNPQKNLTLLNAMAFCRSFMLIMPIFVPLMQRYGLTMQEIMLTQSVFAVVLLLSEIPSGYLADRFGRKTSLIAGYLLTALGFSQVIWADNFWAIVVFEITLGFGFSLVSGADIALAFETEKALGRKQKTAIGNLMSWMNFGEAGSAFAVFALLHFDMQLIIWLQAAIGWLPLLFSVALVEPSERQSKQRTRVGEAIPQFITNSALKILLFVFVAAMSTTYLMTWFNQSLWQAHQLPLEYFALLWGCMSLAVAFASRISARLSDNFLGLNIFVWLAIMLLVAFSLLLLPHWLGFVCAGFIFSLFRGLAATKIKLNLNNQIANEFRASLNSVLGASFRLATLVLGPIMGYAVDQFGAIDASRGIIILIVPAVWGLLILGMSMGVKKNFAARIS